MGINKKLIGDGLTDEAESIQDYIYNNHDKYWKFKYLSSREYLEISRKCNSVLFWFSVFNIISNCLLMSFIILKL